MTLTRQTGAEALYDGLARYQWFFLRLRGGESAQALAMHRQLSPPVPGAEGPKAGAAAWHDWIWSQLRLGDDPQVLDVGCGFGTTILHWASSHSGRFVGLGDNAFQIEKARARARRLGLEGRCRFLAQSFETPIEGRFDAVIAIETLLHASDLERALHNIARSLEPGGLLLSLDDVAHDEEACDDADAAALLAAWRARRLWSLRDWERAAQAAGLRQTAVFDLSAQVRPRPEPVLRRAERSLRALRRVLPCRAPRGAVDAFLGGIALERLYHKRAVQYRCALLARSDA
jgi:SAM-dependent methyltransferase